MNIFSKYQDELFVIEQLHKGDKNAFEWLFKKKYYNLCFYATKLMGNNILSEEIVQDTFVEIWEKKLQIRFTSSVNAYLYTTVHNKCINYLKHQKVISAYKKYIIETKENFNISDIPDSIYNDKNIVLEIENAIKNLPEKCREIFNLSRFDNKKYREIAVLLQISPKTVENQMGIALDKLRKSLKHILTLSFFIFLLSK